MKIRNGFVSNSSSSSFIITADNINKLMSIPYKEDYAKECAIETAEDSKKWFNNHPEYRDEDKKDQKEFSDEDYQKVYDKSIESHKENYKILHNIMNDVVEKTSLELSYNFRRERDENFMKYFDLDKLSFSDKFDTYEITTLAPNGFEKLLPKSLFYLMKKYIDNKKTRLEIYENFSNEIGVDLIYRYENSKWITKHNLYKRDKEEVKKYKEKYENISSREFYYKYLLKKVIPFVLGGGYFKSYVDFPDYLVKFIQIVEKEMIVLCDKLVDDFIEKNKNTTFYEVEYSDGGGCGIDAILLERGLYLDEVDNIKICNH